MIEALRTPGSQVIGEWGKLTAYPGRDVPARAGRWDLRRPVNSHSVRDVVDGDDTERAPARRFGQVDRVEIRIDLCKVGWAVECQVARRGARARAAQASAERVN